MQYNFVLIRTQKGGKYARKILNSIKWLNKNKYQQHKFGTHDFTISEFLDYGYDEILAGCIPIKTVIHARCANPKTKWTVKLRKLEDLGYKVVNSVDTIELTSNKLACSLHLQGKVNHPKSWEYNKKMNWRDFGNNLLEEINDELLNPKYIIAKPLTSLEQGANVRKIEIDYCDSVEDVQHIKAGLDGIPGNKIVIQEYIPYTALHRVIVIGGKALPYTFIDKPEWHPNDWKVSCCLNRTTMKLNENADKELLELAEKTQKLVGGVINFIDIFEVDNNIIAYPENGGVGEWVKPSLFTNAEINTACSLNIHEKLAKLAGRKDWNIHSRIARQLIKELGV